MKLLFLILTLFPVLSYANDNVLFMPLNIRKAYQNGTRSYDGTPGEKYWQNRSEYDIRVRVYPEKALLKGAEEIVYHNDSPDTLRRIVLRLYQNFYLRGNARDFLVDEVSLHEGVDVYDLEIDDRKIDLDDPQGPAERSGTIIRVNLEQPVGPGSSLEISCRWKLTLPRKSWLRMGVYSDSSIFVGYWYPQIAVYDDIDGWDYSEYAGTQEFYNDMSDFKVEITVPGDYLVWATGLLQNAGDVLREPYLPRYQSAFRSDTVIAVIGLNDIGSKNITVSAETNTWAFEAENVPDFAFSVCKNHRWDALSADVSGNGFDRVLVQAVYGAGSPDFHQVAAISKSIIEYLSTEMPGIPYPYPAMTAFNRPVGGGMEFPMMINDGSHTEKARTVSLTGHEILHSYFPFYMGINEIKYAWMDEGWAVALNSDPLKSIMPEANRFNTIMLTYLMLAGKEYDLPMMIPSSMLKNPAYRNASYNRSAVAYQLLRDYLGEIRFRGALTSFIQRWKYKHPIPYDFFFTVNQAAGEDLSWFWEPWFFQRGYPDLSILSALSDSITIERSGLLPVPVKLSIIYDDGSEEAFSESMSIWKDGRKYLKFPLNSGKKLTQAILGSDDIPDVKKSDNEYRVSSP